MERNLNMISLRVSLYNLGRKENHLYYLYIYPIIPIGSNVVSCRDLFVTFNY